MIEKLARAFSKLRGEVQALSQRIDSLPEPKDGVSPKAEEIAALVLEQIPTPKDGVSPNAEDIAALVLEQIPTPKDGVSPKAEDIAALVLEQIPTPKDGISPKAEDIAALVLEQIPTPAPGRDAPPVVLSDLAAIMLPKMPGPKDPPTAQQIAAQMPAPKPGPKGNPGVSITDIKLERNVLFVWLDGVKKRAGKIDVPQITTIPSFGGGARRPSTREESINNTGVDVLSLNEIGDESAAPLASDDAKNDIFEYNAAYRKFRPLSDGTYWVQIFTNANEGAGTADILYYVTSSSTLDGGDSPYTPGFLKEYSVDGVALGVSLTLNLSKDKWYSLRMRNTDGGDVTFTTNLYDTDTGQVPTPAFVLQLTRVI